MGPIALFDKSFLQSLSLDESVWFDHFFLTNICPLFYIETLADLDKTGLIGRTAAEEVQIIANKFPETSSGPCEQHVDLCIRNLMGFDIPMIGQIPLAHARLVMLDGKLNTYSEESPVAQAFSRWYQGDYLEIEQLFAGEWRQSITDLDLNRRGSLYKSLGIDTKICHTLQEAKELAICVLSSNIEPSRFMTYTLTVLGIPDSYHPKIFSRWVSLGSPSIQEHAPYVAFVVSVELFFEIALDNGLISSRRPSNWIDIAYLFYLPFCMVFISSDSLHRNTVPLFLRDNQEFVWGPDLKASLKEIDIFYSLYPDSEKDKGIHAFAPSPPKSVNTLVSDLWDRHLHTWRERKETSSDEERKIPTDTISKFEQIQQAQPFNPDPKKFKTQDIESAAIKRKVRKKKGSWYQIPKDI